VERHGVIQVILQDAEMRWMLRDEHLCCIPDLQAVAKKLRRRRQAVQVTEQKSKINNYNNHPIKNMITIKRELLAYAVS
jgi:hypothetical protein